MRTRIRVVWVLMLGMCLAHGAVARPASGNRSTDAFWLMSQGTWQILQDSPGIVTGGDPKAVVSIQIVFDPNCPWCAKIYQYLKQKHPNIPVRWTPVAYMRPNSYSLAAAMFASSNPSVSLDQNEAHYDFAKLQGGYSERAVGTALTLGHGQRVLQQTWEAKWGGYTPMIFFRDSRGRVFQAQTDQPEVIDLVVKLAAHPLKSYP